MNLKSIRKFTTDTSVQRLTGGQNESLKAGNLVLKPVHEPEKYLWLSECLNQIDFGDLHVAVPIKSSEGNYIENAIGATRYFDAQFFPDRLEEKLKTCRRLNSIICRIAKPPDFDSWENPWTKAQHLAWSHSCISEKELPAEIKVLLSMRTPLEMSNQLVHVDLAGNILFDKNDDPVVIDFTPGFYPKEYAEVLLLIDSMAWYGAPIEEFNLLDLNEDLQQQLILRAVIFRLSVPLFSEPPEECRNYQNNFDGYRSIFGALGLSKK